MTSKPSPEYDKALTDACARIAERKKREAQMSAEEYQRYINEWARLLGEQMADAGEYCPCCNSKLRDSQGR